MKRSLDQTLLPIATVLVLAACADREAAEDTAAAARTQTAETTAAVPAADPVIDVQMGTGVSMKGTVPQTVRRDDFRAGETIFIVARLRGMDGQPVTVNWIGPGGLPAGSETAPVKDGMVYFSKADTKAWLPGDYRVTLSAGPRTLVAEEFHIVGSEAAVMPSK